MDTSSSDETRSKKAKEPAPEESEGGEEWMESGGDSQEASSPQNEEQMTLPMEIIKLKTNMKKMQIELDELKKDKENMLEINKILQADLMNQQTDMNNMRRELDQLKDVISEDCFKSKTSSSSSSSSSWGKATVKVFQVVLGRSFGADKDILEQVKNVGLTSTWKVETTRNRQECDVIIVFCPIMSRVGSDVEAAMREDSVSSGSKPVILVLMHHTRDPNYSTDVRRWSETFQNVVLDVHVLFHETQPGLLRCKTNDRAIQQIQEELKKGSKDQAAPQRQEVKKHSKDHDVLPKQKRSGWLPSWS